LPKVVPLLLDDWNFLIRSDTLVLIVLFHNSDYSCRSAVD
jgi:hypothetical protein